MGMPYTTDKDESIRRLERRFCSEAAAKGHYVSAFRWAMRAGDTELAERYIGMECDKFSDAGFPDAARRFKGQAMELASTCDDIGVRDLYKVEFSILDELFKGLTAKAMLPGAAIDMDEFYEPSMLGDVHRIKDSLDALAAMTAFEEGLFTRVWEGGAEEASIDGYKLTIDRLVTKKPGYEPVYNSIYDTQFEIEYEELEQRDFALQGYVYLRFVEGSALRCMTVVEAGRLVRLMADSGVLGLGSADGQALLAKQIGIAAEYAAAVDFQSIGQLADNDVVTGLGVHEAHPEMSHMDELNALKAGYAGTAYTNATSEALYDVIRGMSRRVKTNTARINACVSMISDFVSVTRDGTAALDSGAVRSFVRRLRTISETYRSGATQLTLDGGIVNQISMETEPDAYTKAVSAAYVRFATEAIITMQGLGRKRFKLPLLLHPGSDNTLGKLNHEERGWNFYISGGVLDWDQPETLVSDTSKSVIYLLDTQTNSGRVANAASIEKLVAYELGRHFVSQLASNESWAELYLRLDGRPATMLVEGLSDILGCYLTLRAAHAKSKFRDVARVVAGLVRERSEAMAERASRILMSDMLNTLSNPDVPAQKILEVCKTLADEAERYTSTYLYGTLRLATGLYDYSRTLISAFVVDSCWREVWNGHEDSYINPRINEFEARIRALDAGADGQGNNYVEQYKSSYKHEAADIELIRELKDKIAADLSSIGSGIVEEMRKSIKSLDGHIRALYANETDRARRLEELFSLYYKANSNELPDYLSEANKI